MKTLVIKSFSLKGALILSIIFTSMPYAAEINVTPGAVDDLSNGNCSLIEAIRSANTDSAVDACPAGSGADQLNLGGATYSLTGVIDPSYGYNATPCITTHISVIGGGAHITRSSSADFRLLCVDTNGQLVIEGASISNGNADGPSLSHQRGGAILVLGNLDLENVELSGSSAAQQGGALFVDGGTANLSNSTFEGNSAIKGGAVRSDSNASITIVGSVLSNNRADFGGATFFNNSVANINRSVISNNNSNYQGGGLHYSGSRGNITYTNIEGNTTTNVKGNNIREKGAGIRIDNSSNVAISNSVIDGNSVPADDDGRGGGIHVIESNLTLSKTTISNNTAGRGAGMYVDVADAIIQNTTISGNSAAVYGGGIYVDSYATLDNFHSFATLKHVTVSSNSASTGGAGIWLNPRSRATLINSIVAKNANRDCGIGSSGGYSGSLRNNGGNWFGDNTCTGTANGDPMLGALSSNGGPKKTHALLPGSPAIDQGILKECLPTDQPGKTRPIGSSCEPGANEFRSVTISPIVILLLSPSNG